MIRKSTWVVFIVFLIVALAAIFLLKSPASPLPAGAAQTPSVTPAPRAIEGWDSTQVVGVEFVNLNGSNQHFTKNADGSWLDASKQTPVESGKVEELLSELLAIRVMTVMPTDYALDALALTAPKQKIVITRQDGGVLEFSIGNITPTGNGYYVQIDKNSPVVVSNYAVDAVTKLFADIQATATPAVMPTTEVTPTP